ncbi:MAG: hypothetical protein U9O82_08830 [Thermodesulfobacteriota bacterium]|nr:hypothetical protein [Thermodesulfobacteriota bacterium]
MAHVKITACLLTVYFFIFVVSPAQTAPLQPDKVPEPLKPWTDWVLHDHEEELNCSAMYNNGNSFRCDWPTEIKLTLDNRSGGFEQTWLIQNEKWVFLPGNEKNWPENVFVNGKGAAVVSRNGMPAIFLQKGEYAINGRFTWTRLPEFLQIPAHTALVSLNLNNQDILFPRLDESGRLWLQTIRQKQEKIEDRLNLKVFRHISDSIPARITVRVEMDVSGSAREIYLGKPLSPDEYIPVSLYSGLPARLESNGRIRVQVRPGRWVLTLTARRVGLMQDLLFEDPGEPWAEEEIWVFEAHNNLRIVEIKGGTPIDPQQTTLPDNWRNFPAFVVQPGDTLRFKEIKRGDPTPAQDQLSINRNIWLRFDGKGYTVQDTITGTKNTGWRLEMKPPVKLGRVAVDGQEQFITKRKGSNRAGVELRRGNINLTADSEITGDISGFTATGWAHDFQKVSARLHLPPGWRLINAKGVDNIRSTWLKRWTLLDLFLVLIITLAIAKLWNRPLAGIALITLAITYHEPNAPRFVWLHLLAGVTLLRILPVGKLKTAAKLYLGATILILALVILPFMVNQARLAIYPQLEKPWQSMQWSARDSQHTFRSSVQPAQVMEMEADSARMVRDKKESLGSLVSKRRYKGYGLESRPESYKKIQPAQYDPNMINQTGPGLPTWKWHSINMDWSGPVEQDQEIRLLLFGPRLNMILSFARVVLLGLLVLGMLEIRYTRGKGLSASRLGSIMSIVLLFALGCTFSIAEASEIPSTEMFDQLRSRLLEKSDCFPHCADSSKLVIKINREEITMTMDIVGCLDVAVPLPGTAKQWLPNMIKLDGKQVSGLFRTKDGKYWLLVSKGSHRIDMSGRLPNRNTVQLPLPLKPHRVEVHAKGWNVEGVHENGQADNQLQLKRITRKEEKTADRILEPGVLPPFVKIERTLLLGLKWQVQTIITRLSPTGSAIMLEVPLLSGESVTTEGIRVENNRALINIDSHIPQVTWQSSLDRTIDLSLEHAQTNEWTEIWKVNVSPIWHMEYEGIPVIHHQEGNQWFPVWQPWPGEKVTLHITRPEGVEGRSITIDRTHVEIRPGQRATDTKLEMFLRSSQGGRHALTLPPGAELLNVFINNQSQPISQDGRSVTLPIVPGKQKIEMLWRESSGILNNYRTSLIDLGIENVNTFIDIHMPRDRWTLFTGGPQLGPAVLFWSIIIIIVLVSLGLGRLDLTPLRFHHWLLLGIGMSQAEAWSVLVVAGWLLALGWRKKVNPDMDKRKFDLLQVALGLLTVAAILTLIYAISNGLLGHPDMQIKGNGSNSWLLRWYQDHSGPALPHAWVISIPMFYYRMAMLAWALWISFWLLRILRWGWECFTTHAIWHTIPRKPKKSRKLPPELKKDELP